MNRRTTRSVFVGNIGIGSEYPITVQSMTNTDTRDVEATLAQIRRLHEAKCEIVRVAVPDQEAADALKRITAASPLPVVADIHFDYRLALTAIENGVQKIRLNPGNIGGHDRVEAVVKSALAKRVPIRIGVNGGSLDRRMLDKYGGVTAEGIVESALEHIGLLEKYQFNDIVVALKSSDINLTLKAYELLANECPYPFHIGLTEAGTPFRGTIKSSIAIGGLLTRGLGDTLRVSLTGDPVEEVKVGREILKSLELREFGIKFVSCPTCGRCQFNLEAVANAVESRVGHLEKDLTVAIMGCAVNGPGEAREADIGIAGGKDSALLIKKGEIVGKYSETEIVDVLCDEIERM